MKRARALWVAAVLILVLGGSIFIAYVLDDAVVQVLAKLRAPFLDTIFVVVTSSAFLLATLYGLPLLFLFAERKLRRHIPYLIATLALTSGFIALMKQALARPRPPVEHLVFAGGFSFPSSHAAVSFAAIPLLFVAFPRRKAFFAAVAAIIALSRVYVGVHYLSDVLVGAAIGLLIGEFIVSFGFGKSAIELRRKLFHMLFGSVLFLLIYIGKADVGILGILLVTGIALSLVARGRVIWGISWCLDKLDRKGKIPGKGAITLVAGIVLSLIIFPREVAFVAILSVVFLDAAATLAGKVFGKTRNPLNPHKTIEGSLAGLIVAFLWCTVFFSWKTAAVAGVIAMLVEAVEGGIFSIDDNITIPLITGAALLLIPPFA